MEERASAEFVQFAHALIDCGVDLIESIKKTTIKIENQ
jgi:hypothetical protein